MDGISLTPTASQAMTRDVLRDGIIGSLFGSALGDAVGLYTKFLSEELSIQAYPERKVVLSPPSQATRFAEMHIATHITLASGRMTLTMPGSSCFHTYAKTALGFHLKTWL